MKKLNKWSLLLVMLMAGVLLLSGCAGKEDTKEVFATAPDVTVEPTSEPVGSDEDMAALVNPVLATVNGYPVLQNEVEQITSNMLSVYAAYGMNVSSAETAAMFRQAAMNYVMQMAMLDAKADEWGIKGPEGEALAQLTAEQHDNWENTVAYYMENMFGASAASGDAEKASARVNAEALLATLGYTEQVMVDSAVREVRREQVQAEMVKDVAVSDEEVQAAYEARITEAQTAYQNDPVNYINAYEMNIMYGGQPAFYVPEGYRSVLQILLPVDNKLLSDYQELAAKLEEQVEKQLEAQNSGEAAPEATVTQEQVDAAAAAIIASVQTKYDEIAAGLAGGTSFLDLIDQYNIDPGMKNEANRAEGYRVHMDSVIYDPAFITAAFSTKAIGEISQPTVGSYGVYVVYYLRDMPAGPVQLTESLHSSLMASLVEEKEDAILNDTMNAWMNEAAIEVTDMGNAYVLGR